LQFEQVTNIINTNFDNAKLEGSQLPWFWDSKYCGSNLRLSNSNKTVTKSTGGDGWNAGVLGTKSVNLYKVIINTMGRTATL